MIRATPLIVIYYGPDLVMRPNATYVTVMGYDPTGLPLRAAYDVPEYAALVQECRAQQRTIVAWIDGPRTSGLATFHPLPDLDAVGFHYLIGSVRTDVPPTPPVPLGLTSRMSQVRRVAERVA